MKTTIRMTGGGLVLLGWCLLGPATVRAEADQTGLALQVTTQTGETLTLNNAVLKSWNDVIQIGNPDARKVLPGLHLFPERTGELTIPWDRIHCVSFGKHARFQSPTQVRVYLQSGGTNELGRLQDYTLDRHAFTGDSDLGVRTLALDDVADVVVLPAPPRPQAPVPEAPVVAEKQ